ncbi:hypothetical protein ALC60_00257 [Trachymyrmex zeteki]|uniref:Uncharacterized protein n=1 Tax=Mycetomoellerius zeteki TaxID=64791 RepID=A0A151XJN7_9HYME|nr:hypothetical protein ALC60_00257 [Trachymyrmex zeteki]
MNLAGHFYQRVERKEERDDEAQSSKSNEDIDHSKNTFSLPLPLSLLPLSP